MVLATVIPKPPIRLSVYNCESTSQKRQWVINHYVIRSSGFICQIQNWKSLTVFFALYLRIKYKKLLYTCPANTKHLYNIYTTSAQRLRRWSNVVYILYKCFVFVG